MHPNQPHFSPSTEQPFPGAVKTYPAPQQHQAVMEIPLAMQPTSFLFHTDGSVSTDGSRAFSAWSRRLGEAMTTAPTSTYNQRLYMLKAACEKQDIFYIFMHHGFCTWSHNRAATHHLLRQFASPDVVNQGFDALQVLLHPNSLLSQAELDFFCKIPAPTFDHLLPPPILAELSRQLSNFIFSFSKQWHRAAQCIVERKFPFLAYEMRDALRCPWGLVHNLLFTISHRLLGCQDDLIANRFSEIFSRDQSFEFGNLSNPRPSDHVKRHRDTVAAQYTNLLRNHHSQMTVMARGQAAQGRNQIQHCQVSMTTTPSGFPRNAILPSMQNQPSQLSGPSANTSLPTVHQALPVTIPSQPREAPIFMAQQPQNTGPAENLAARLDPNTVNISRRIPEAEYPQSAHGLPSLRVGLHLALQRSPKRLPRILEPTKYFQHVDNIVSQPTKLDVVYPLTEIEFSLTGEHFIKLPVPQVDFNVCSLPIVRFEDNSLRYRVRVCRFPSGDSVMSESKWVEARVFWPEELHLTVNDEACLLSRKQHFHTDLPADISARVRPGPNKLRVSLPFLANSERGYDYFIAVEQVTVQRYSSVWRTINGNPHISAEMTRDRIRQFNRQPDNNEISVISSTLNISVCDPISSKVCTLAVRGVNCKHIDCFDLEKFLHSRPGKPGSSQPEPCLVDCWACPICHGDVRPNQLRICDYFSQVLEQLLEGGHAEIRTIAISENGDWRPQQEKLEEASSQPGAPRQPPHPPEVIEILDD